MPTYRITDPETGRTVKLTGDSPPTEAELNEVFSSLPRVEKPPLQNSIQTDSNPMALIAKAAPSNIGKLMGVAGANAPSLANTILNAMPGIGQPSRLTSDVQQLASNPRQVLQAIQRVKAVQGGSPLMPIEKTPAMIGKVGGTALEVLAQPGILPSVKPSGPFTAGVAQPATAAPGAFEKAGEALGKAKDTANAGAESPVVGELLTRLENSKEAKGLLTEARNWVASGMKKDVPNAVLLAYKQVLGEAQAEGGTFANVYAQSVKKVNERLVKQAPELASKMDQMALQFMAKGNPKAGFPWLTMAVNPAVGAAKAAILPSVRNVAGAIVGSGLKSIPKAASLVNSVVGNKAEKKAKELQNPVIPAAAIGAIMKYLTKNKAKEYLKEAEGDRDLARKRAKEDGYNITKLKK